MRWSVKITNFFLLSFGYCILGNYIKEITKRPVIRCTCSSNHVIDVKRASWIAISARCAHISAWTLTFPNECSARLSYQIPVLKISFALVHLLKFKCSEKATKFWDSSPYFWLALHRTKVRWRFCKILWPSQNIWTLPKRCWRI